MRPVFRFFLWSSVVLLLLLAAAGTAGYLTYTRLQSELPDINPVLNYRPALPLRIYSADGMLLAELGAERRTPLRIDQIPLKVQQAFIAAEDARFYQHGGVDLNGILRAAWANFRAGTIVQGASTITQQVARNFFLDSDQTFQRKIKEALLAMKIERHLDKKSILALYLNQIYLGNGAYGVQAAAHSYFNKDLKDLSLPQIALLAGLPKAPSAFNPTINPERAKIRRNYVLHRMAVLGFISQAQAEAASQAPLNAGQYAIGNNIAPYATEEVRQWAVSHFGEQNAYRKGLKIYTTISSKDQEEAHAAVVNGVEAYDHRHGYRGPIAHLSEPAMEAVLEGKRPHQLPAAAPAGLHWALVLNANAKEAKIYLDSATSATLSLHDVSWARRFIPHRGWTPTPKKVSEVLHRGDLIWVRADGKAGWELTQIPQVQAGFVALDAETGRILAMVGGYSFDLSKFNHVTQAWRQPGSSFKPFIYAAAMDGDALNVAGERHVFTPASIIDDAPFSAVDGSGKLWRPSNYDGESYGPSSLRQALARSQNLVSIRVLQAIGLPYARDYIQRFGFDRKQLPNGLSLALGSASVTLLQMAAAYTPFANNGLLAHPYLIERVVNAQGQTLPLNNCALCAQVSTGSTVLPPSVAFLTTSLMQDVVKYGTAAAAKSLGRSDIAGKTGTTNDSRDAWFLGFTPHIVAGAWVGYDQPRSLGHQETGARAALPIWMDFMRSALKDQPEEDFRQPPDVVVRDINPKSGVIVPTGGVPEYFSENYLPPMAVITQDTTAPDLSESDAAPAGLPPPPAFAPVPAPSPAPAQPGTVPPPIPPVKPIAPLPSSGFTNTRNAF